MPEADKGRSQFDLGALSGFGAAAAALAYATGTLTINIYLHQLGITDFSLAKPKLVLTGILVLLTFLLLAPLPVFVAWLIGTRGQDGRVLPPSREIVFWMLLPVLGLIAASASLFLGDIPGLGQTAAWRVWEFIKPQSCAAKALAGLLIAAEVYVPVCLAGVSAFAATRLFDQVRVAGTYKIHPEKLVYFLFVTALAVASIVGYIYAFSITFYPAISSEFGGGKPYFERFLIAEDGRCQLQQLGIPFNTDQPNITQFLPVLHESTALVAVWLKESAADEHLENEPYVVVQFDKAQINAVAVAGPNQKPKQHPQLLPLVPCVPGPSPADAHGHTP
jgi:hypothetical protein